MQVFFMIPLKIASVSTFTYFWMKTMQIVPQNRIKTPYKLFSTEENTKYTDHNYFIQDWPHLTQESQVVSIERVRNGRKKELFIIQF